MDASAARTTTGTGNTFAIGDTENRVPILVNVTATSDAYLSRI